MKKLAYLVIILCNSILANAQWNSQIPPTSNATFKTIYFLNQTTGFSFGNDANGGLVLKTIDGGSTWTYNPDLQPYFIQQACFTSATTAYICGGNSANKATILKSIDGGATWVPSQLNSSYPLLNLHFYDDNHGFTSDVHGTFFRTNDGGNTWSIINSGWGLGGVLSIFSLNASSIFVASDNIYGAIRKSTDGGINWTTMTYPTVTSLNDIFFANANTAWSVGTNGTILKTTDGGATWIQQSSGTSEPLNSVHFMNVQEGYTVGNNGVILKTINGGTTWTSEISNTTNSLWSVFSLSPTQSYVAGASNTIKTTFNGNTPAGIVNEELIENKFFYPNPITSNFLFRGDKNHVYKVRMLNSFGQKMYELEGNLEEINTKLPSSISWANGIYFAQIIDLNMQQTKTEKLIKL